MTDSTAVAPWVDRGLELVRNNAGFLLALVWIGLEKLVALAPIKQRDIIWDIIIKGGVAWASYVKGKAMNRKGPKPPSTSTFEPNKEE